MVMLGHRIRLYPNNKQRTLLSQTVGVARFAYNYALDLWENEYKAGNKPSESKIRKYLNSIKGEQFPWMYNVSKCAPQQAIKNLGKAFQRFFNKESGYPRFKKRGVAADDKAYFDNGNFKLRKNGKIHLANIGDVRLAEKLRFSGKLISATISREADQWYVSICVEVEDVTQTVTQTTDVIGSDVGTREYKDSDGISRAVPRIYRTNERKLRRLQQSVSRKQIGSKNRAKAKIKVAKCHARIKNVRNDWLHKYTTDLVANNQIIGIENLNVRGMVKNKHLAKSIADASFGEFRRQLEYKATLYGRTIIVVPRFFPSSKLCNKCKTKTKSLSLSTRTWKCDECSEVHDRDVNAAINIRNYAIAVSSTVSACGEFLPLSHLLIVDELSTSMKQEINKKFNPVRFL